MCSDKAANWKHVQLEIMEDSEEPPCHLYNWSEFQKNFWLKWCNLNTMVKAQQRFYSGLRQTTSVCQYAEFFEETMLEASFHDKKMIAGAFYNGLKSEVKMHLVGRRPDGLEELKAIAIQLDEECMAAQSSET